MFSYRSNKKLQTKNIAIKTKNKTIIQVGAANMILIPNTITTIIAMIANIVIIVAITIIPPKID